MISPLGVAGALVAVAALTSGMVMVRAGVSRLAGWFLIGAGVSAVCGMWLGATQPGAGDVLLIVAWMVLLPAALWAYPRPRWHHPVDGAFGVVLVGPGLVACLYAGRGGALTVLGITAALALMGQTWWRLERSDVRERRALTWAALGICVASLLSLALLFTVNTEAGAAVGIGLLAAVPVSLAVGVLRPDTVDVRGLVVAATVALTLGIGYVAYFIGVMAVLDLSGATAQPIVLAGIGLAGGLALRPAGKVLHGVMDQLLFGDRPDPLKAATRAVGGVGEDPQAALESVRGALALPYAALLRGEVQVAACGEPVPHERRLVAGSSDGEVTLVVGMRPGDLRLSPGDAQVLRLVAPLLAQLVRSQQLSAALQESRTTALTGIADERRRLRRDLHDGLGPTLTGVALSLDAAGNRLPGDPAGAAELLAAARADTVDAIGQIRSIVYGMRPPALDDLGLVAALRQQSRALGGRLEVSFDVPQTLPPLPAAVEVAAYRIVIEALTNVARHSGSCDATVRLGVGDEALLVEVADSGTRAGQWPAGVGVASMRERAAELGGVLTAGPDARGGVVRAVLPLA